MRTSSRAELGDELRRDQTKSVEARWWCDARWAVLAALLSVSAAAGGQTVPARGADELPDAPSARMSQDPGQDSQSQVSSSDGEGRPAEGAIAQATRLRKCRDSDYPAKEMPLQGPPPCIPENPISPFVTSVNIEPLTSRQKALLAWRDFKDPFNFVTIAGYSAVAVASNSHSAYGPAFQGWAKLTGYGLVEDAQGEFFQTYAIPSLVHQDPRYHRDPHASVKRRILHAIAHTYVARSDDGRAMPNYATLLTYPISAELSNLYVPGIETDGPQTGKRILIGIATDPSGALVAEFLPDVARHIRIHIQFVQELVDAAMIGAPSVQ